MISQTIRQCGKASKLKCDINYGDTRHIIEFTGHLKIMCYGQYIYISFSEVGLEEHGSP